MTPAPLAIGPESASDEAQRPSDGAAQAADGTSSAFSGSGASLATLEDAAERADHYAGRSKSPATIAAYAAGWRDFLDFCQLRGLEPCLRVWTKQTSPACRAGQPSPRERPVETALGAGYAPTSSRVMVLPTARRRSRSSTAAR